MRAGGFNRVIVVLYVDESLDEQALPRTSLVEGLHVRLEVREALLVRRDRVSSYLCDNGVCCPPEGHTYLDGDDATNVAAAHILHGRSVLMTRQQVIDSIAPDTEWVPRYWRRSPWHGRRCPR